MELDDGKDMACRAIVLSREALARARSREAAIFAEKADYSDVRRPEWASRASLRANSEDYAAACDDLILAEERLAAVLDLARVDPMGAFASDLFAQVSGAAAAGEPEAGPEGSGEEEEWTPSMP